MLKGKKFDAFTLHSPFVETLVSLKDEEGEE